MTCLTPSLRAPTTPTACPNVEIPATGVEVVMGPVADGAPPHLARHMEQATQQPVDVVTALRDADAQVMLNMLPTGSAKAARIYAQAALEAGVAFINGMPELIVCDESYARAGGKSATPSSDRRRRQEPVGWHDPASGDGRNHAGARGFRLRRPISLTTPATQTSIILSTAARARRRQKRGAVEALIPYQADVSAAFAHVSNMADRKTARFYFELANFSNAPIIFDAKLEVEDSANFAGVAVDAIRCCRLALDRGTGGVLTSASAGLLQAIPRQQMPDEQALRMLEEFIQGNRLK